MEKNTRISDKQSNGELLNFYLKVGLAPSQVEQLLKQQISDSDQVDKLVSEYEPRLKKIKKLAKKFVMKIEQRYGHLDTPELMRKGIKFASKHNLSEAEIEAFKRLSLKGDVDTPYTSFQDMEYTEMAKFFGFSSHHAHNIPVKATDQAPLNELARLYEQSKPIHSAIRNNLAIYEECSPDTLAGEYDSTKHNSNSYIHPLIVALFLPTIAPLQDRMMMSNIGRLVVQRTQLYFQTQADSAKQFNKYSQMMPNGDMLQGELQADLELAYDISRDPNSLNYFSEESPMSNLLKRFTIQIELWKNILSLRSGKFFAQGDSFDTNNSIAGLQQVLSSYDWTYFDSPDLYQVQDEGTLLRKLLAVFSYRPTFTQVSSFVHRTGMGQNFGSMAQATFINTPICNVKLPQMQNNQNGQNAQDSIRLENALQQSPDWFIENKMLIPKQKTVMHSNKVIFFYVNRRHHQINYPNVNLGFNYVNTPGQISGQRSMTTINTSIVEYSDVIHVGSSGTRFVFKSAVVLNELIGNLSAGCSSIVLSENVRGLGNEDTMLMYNPLACANLVYDGITTRRNRPLSSVFENATQNSVSWRNELEQRGTVYVYVDEAL
jgi:hypothetical protein